MIEWMPSYTTQENYEADQQTWLGKFIRKILLGTTGPLQMFDVGANRGHITDCMISAADGHDYLVHAVDPHPVYFNLLQEKYQHNPRVKIYPHIASDVKNNHEKFHYSIQDGALSYFKHSPAPERSKQISDWQTTERKTIRIDDIVDQNAATPFIKIDAEGHDFFVLQGSQWTLSNHRPYVLFEFSGKLNCNDYGYTPKQWLQFFKERQYELVAPMGKRNQKFVLSHFNVYHPDLHDILAFPIEKKQMLSL